jgi:cytochrome b pre-mRNA-processing protein 3
MADGFFKRLLRGTDSSDPLRPLYAAVVAEARCPDWYQEGDVPDTMDGRFEMVSAVMAIVFIRLDAIGVSAAEAAVRLADVYAEDMEGQLRQIGIGDAVVGKHMGKLVGALGGRLGAYREGLVAQEIGGGSALEDALGRNLYRGAAPAPAGLTFTAAGLRALHERVSTRSLDQLMAAEL